MNKVFLSAIFICLSVSANAQTQQYDDCIRLARAAGAMVELRDGNVPISQLKTYVLPNVGSNKKEVNQLFDAVDYVYSNSQLDREQIVVDVFSMCYRPVKP